MCEQGCDVAIVGAGPAGLAAAHTVAGHGLTAVILDDNPAPGGQIWRGEVNAWTVLPPSMTLVNARVLGPAAPRKLIAETGDRPLAIRYEKLLLATGARERFLPFPGWTLPGVFGAGGLQALAKCGLPVDGKRVVVAGTGPLLLEVGSYLRRHGARVALIAEQAPWTTLARFAAALQHTPSKVQQALSVAGDVAAILRCGAWIEEAHGTGSVEAVTVCNGRRRWQQPSDYLACGFHLVPNLELAILLGCQLEAGFVLTDQWQQTTASGVFCAGEPCGIGGVDKAVVEGRIAGHAMAQDFSSAAALHPIHEKARRFQAALDRATRLRPELEGLATQETIVCRCEDVPLGAIRDCSSWRSAKLLTRCGMGPCQGRVCGAALEQLLGWQRESMRPPAFPARVATMASFEP